MKALFLDTSAVVKRHLPESGSDAVDAIYRAAALSRIRIVYCLWTVGEFFGVIDRLRRQGRVSERHSRLASEAFVAETLRLGRQDTLTVVPLATRLVVDSWDFIRKHHLYEADALILQAAKASRSDLFVSGDYSLVQIASKEGIAAAEPARDASRIAETVRP